MNELLKTALMTQDYSVETAARVAKEVEDKTFCHPDDAITAVVIWAVTQENEGIDEILTNFDYAINQLRRAQEAVDKYQKKA